MLSVDCIVEESCLELGSSCKLIMPLWVTLTFAGFLACCLHGTPYKTAWDCCFVLISAQLSSSFQNQCLRSRLANLADIEDLCKLRSYFSLHPEREWLNHYILFPFTRTGFQVCKTSFFLLPLHKKHSFQHPSCPVVDI